MFGVPRKCQRQIPPNIGGDPALMLEVYDCLECLAEAIQGYFTHPLRIVRSGFLYDGKSKWGTSLTLAEERSWWLGSIRYWRHYRHLVTVYPVYSDSNSLSVVTADARPIRVIQEYAEVLIGKLRLELLYVNNEDQRYPEVRVPVITNFLDDDDGGELVFS